MVIKHLLVSGLLTRRFIATAAVFFQNTPLGRYKKIRRDLNGIMSMLMMFI
jgi:hypothetical protein